MQLYEVSPYPGTTSVWYGTRGEAHEAAKLKAGRTDVRLYLWEMPTDKACTVSRLNGNPSRGAMINAWRLSPRGGLVEMTVAEATLELQENEL